MKVQGFPLCCGAYILTDFGNTGNSGGYRGEITPEEAEKYLNEKAGGNVYKSFVAILNHDQREKLGKIFYKAGFRMRSKFWHAAHNNYCYYYIKNPKDPNEI